MLVLNINDVASETGKCDGLNPKRPTLFVCELVKQDGTIEDLEYKRNQ